MAVACGVRGGKRGGERERRGQAPAGRGALSLLLRLLPSFVPLRQHPRARRAERLLPHPHQPVGCIVLSTLTRDATGAEALDSMEAAICEGKGRGKNRRGAEVGE